MNLRNGIKIGLKVILLILIALLGSELLGSDFAVTMRWWLVVLLLGISCIPVSSLFFDSYQDGGWIFSKTLGLLLNGWLFWLLSSLKLLRFTQKNCIICIVICFTVNIIFYCIYQYVHPKKNLITISIDRINNLLKIECILFALFILWTYLRGFNAKAYGTEKFMDYGFMTSMMRSEYMPPNDMWLSGYSINYYYFGQYLATFLTKVSGVGAEYGYNLMLSTLAAFGFGLPYAIVQRLTSDMIQMQSDVECKNKRCIAGSAKSRWLPGIAGVIGGYATAYAGNLHYPIFKFLAPIAEKLQGLEVTSYWFPDATRYIGYNPETSDKTIHEFPMYSFVLGDLHAHVIDILFVLTLVAIMYAWYKARINRMEEARRNNIASTISLKTEALHPVIWMLGFFIGIFKMTNYWDFPIYFVVSGAVILFSNLIVFRFHRKALLLTAIQAAVVLVTATIVSIPFTSNFQQMASGVMLVANRTPVQQLLILWGTPAMLIIVYLAGSIRDMYRNKEIVCFADREQMQVPAKGEFPTKKRNVILQYIWNMQLLDLFVIILGLCGLGLVVLTELVYVKDIYSGDYKRANTIFKLTYQSYMLFGICMGYLIPKMFVFWKKHYHRTVAIFGFILLFLASLYSVEAVKDWFGDIADTSRNKGIDATAFMEEENYNDYLATNWLNENVEGDPVVLESNGDSYTFAQRVSVNTGLPTVLGWRTHEWLWRSTSSNTGYPEICTERQTDIETVYTATDVTVVQALIRKYDIRYIYVGDTEETKYVEKGINHTLLRSLGTVVFTTDADTSDGDYGTYIIQIQ